MGFFLVRKLCGNHHFSLTVALLSVIEASLWLLLCIPHAEAKGGAKVYLERQLQDRKSLSPEFSGSDSPSSSSMSLNKDRRKTTTIFSLSHCFDFVWGVFDKMNPWHSSETFCISIQRDLHDRTNGKLYLDKYVIAIIGILGSLCYVLIRKDSRLHFVLCSIWTCFNLPTAYASDSPVPRMPPNPTQPISLAQPIRTQPPFTNPTRPPPFTNPTQPTPFSNPTQHTPFTDPTHYLPPSVSKSFDESSGTILLDSFCLFARNDKQLPAIKTDFIPQSIQSTEERNPS